MSLDLSDDTLIDTVWFVSWDKGDLLGYVFKPLNRPWIGEYRFRKYHDEDPWSVKDAKRFYTYTNKYEQDGPDSLLSLIALVVQIMASTFQGTIYTLIIKSKGKEAEEFLRRQPWVHCKEMPADPLTLN